MSPTSSVDAAVAALREGRLAVFPTETLWSLSARALVPEAVQAVFAAKGRPGGVPLAVGFPSWGMARQYVRTTGLADALAQTFLPGPLSIVVDRADDRLAHVAPGLPTISVRVPDHPVALEILDRVGPCVMTSANRHNEPDPITAAQVRAALPGILVVGQRVRGEPSTIVDARGEHPVVLRRGVVPAEHLEQA